MSTASSLELPALHPSDSFLEPEPLTYGNYKPFFKRKSGGYYIFIGPHWWMSLIGLFLITFVGTCLISVLWPHLPVFWQLYLLSVILLLDGIYLLAIISDPGIIPRKGSKMLISDRESSKQECKICGVPREEKVEHCSDCDVCIEGYDHHCVWVGKCVGQKNLTIFWAFVGCVPLFFLSLMVAASMTAGSMSRIPPNSSINA